MSLSGFFYLYTQGQDRKTIENELIPKTSKLCQKHKIPMPKIKINTIMLGDMCVKYAYGWVSDERVFNAFIGKNIDGSDRIEEEEDKNFVKPSISKEEALKGVKDWNEIFEIEEKYEIPKIKKQLSPLIKLENIDIVASTASLAEYEYNVLECWEPPKEINESILKEYFLKFSFDKGMHIDKAGKKFEYPIVKKIAMKGKNLFKIEFSPLYRNNAKHVANVCKITLLDEFIGNGSSEKVYFNIALTKEEKQRRMEEKRAKRDIS